MKIALIVGCARSGTSILGELIAAHPEVKYIIEAHEIWEFAGLGPNESHRLTESHATPEVIAKIRAWFAAQSDGRMLLEKNPRNSLAIPFVRRVFPEAKIIYIIRDGRDVACSLMPGIGGTEWRHLKPENWRDLQRLPPIERCAHTWKEVVTVADQDLGAGEYLRIVYEDFVRHPESNAIRVLAFLGLRLTPGVFSFCRRIQNETNTSYVAEYSQRWNTEDHASRISRWRENLTTEEQRRVGEILGGTLRALGYPVS